MYLKYGIFFFESYSYVSNTYCGISNIETLFFSFPGSCDCNDRFYGPRCQYEEECLEDDDCGNGRSFQNAITQLMKAHLY